MDTEQKEVEDQKQTTTSEQSVSSKTEEINSQLLETLKVMNERLSKLEKQESKPEEDKKFVPEEDVYKSLVAQAEMMKNQSSAYSSQSVEYLSPEEKSKQLEAAIDFSFMNGAYSNLELRQEIDNPYVAYSRNSYIFRRFFAETGAKPRFDNVEELTRYYTNKNKLNPLSIL